MDEIDASQRENMDTVEAKKSNDELASSYALQVALQTMKERCRQLQSRLSKVEEENYQLRIENGKIGNSTSQTPTNNTFNSLREQIEQLNRQKSQLTHHIYMVATENKHLWTRLSLLTEANESLGTRLSKISAAFNTNNNPQEPRRICNNEELQTIISMSSMQNNEISTDHINRMDVNPNFDQRCNLLKLDDIEDTKEFEFIDSSEENCDIFEVNQQLDKSKRNLTEILELLKKQKRELNRLIEQTSVGSKVTRNYREACTMTTDLQIATNKNDKVESKKSFRHVSTLFPSLEDNKLKACLFCNLDFSSSEMDSYLNHLQDHHFVVNPDLYQTELLCANSITKL